jgi:hypothetical protein
VARKRRFVVFTPLSVARNPGTPKSSGLVHLPFTLVVPAGYSALVT